MAERRGGFFVRSLFGGLGNPTATSDSLHSLADQSRQIVSPRRPAPNVELAEAGLAGGKTNNSNGTPSKPPRSPVESAKAGASPLTSAMNSDAEGLSDSERQSFEPVPARGRGRKQPMRVLASSVPFGRSCGKAFKSSPCLFFCLAQILIVGFVGFAVHYFDMQAVQMLPRQKLKSALGNPGFLQKLREQLQDRCPLHGPVCRETASYADFYAKDSEPRGRAMLDDEGARDGGEKPSADLPLVVFFIGVEGSGHKFFEQVFRHLPVNFSVVAYEPDLHLTAEKSQSHVHGADIRCPLLPYPRPLRAFAKEFLERLREVGPGPYLRARDSYPLGRVRTPLARPDLLHLLQLDGHLYTLKVVVLQRGLADAVRSTWRMGYHGGDIGLQTRIVEDEMAFLDTAIRMVPCGKYIVLDFDWIADDPKLVAQPLAEFLDLGLSEDDVIKAVHSAKQTKPKHQTAYPEFGGQPVEEFFALRTEMWPLLATCRLAPYFWPHSPHDWPEESGGAYGMMERRKGYDYEG